MKQRLIDADALKEYIDCGHLRNPCEVCFSELDVVNLIDNAPTAETDMSEYSDRLYKLAYERGKAESVKRGKWMEMIEANELGEPYQSGVCCSECGHTDTYESNYCPECGARMDKDD